MDRDAPPRPSTVPADATWSPQEREWILGERDDAGRLDGLVHYWRPDGTQVCACPHRAGKPHGEALRFHESGEVSQRCTYADGVLHGLRVWIDSDAPTSERMHAGGMQRSIWRAEVDYEDGVARAFRYFLRDGREVAVDGEPLPPRPAAVPAAALWSPRQKVWIAGDWGERGEPVGDAAVYDRRGVLLHTQRYQGGRLDGVWSYFYEGGGPRLRIHYRQGVFDGPVEVFDGSGEQVRRGEVVRCRTRWVADLAADGGVVRRLEFAPALEGAGEDADTPDAPDTSDTTHTADTAAASADEAAWLALLDDDETCADAAEHLRPQALSPAAIATALAIGWGGDEDRSQPPARAARRLIRERAPPSLRARLRDLGLDRAPRIFTASRLAHVADVLASDPAVDTATLHARLAARGGPGRVLAFEAGGPGALAALAAARVGDNLNLSAAGLRQLPRELGQLADLRRLDLSRNRLRSLPDALGGLLLLTRLDLGHNRIRALPPTLAGLSELTALHLADNDLEDLPRARRPSDETRGRRRPDRRRSRPAAPTRRSIERDLRNGGPRFQTT